MSNPNPTIGGRTKTSWVKGQSGNPGGVKRGQGRARVDIKALARDRAPDAIRVLSSVMMSPKQLGSNRIAAATAILDRAYGKPLQTIDITAILGAFDLTKLSDEQLEQWESLVHEAAGPTVDKSGLPAIIEGELAAALDMQSSVIDQQPIDIADDTSDSGDAGYHAGNDPTPGDAER